MEHFRAALADLEATQARITVAIEVMRAMADGAILPVPVLQVTTCPPAPERKTKRAKRETNGAARETQEDLPPTQTMLIEEALAKAPRSVSELRTILATKGCKVEEKNIAQTCYYLRQQGRIHKPESERGLGSDGKWTLGKGKD